MNTEHKTETTDDELIAIWDGWERHHKPGYSWKRYINGAPYKLHKLKYKTSFDWIMPVVEKINSGAIDDYTYIHIDDDSVHYHLKGDNAFNHKYGLISINGDLIGAIYKAVVIVLRWAENRKA